MPRPRRSTTEVGSECSAAHLALGALYITHNYLTQTTDFKGTSIYGLNPIINLRV